MNTLPAYVAVYEGTQLERERRMRGFLGEVGDEMRGPEKKEKEAIKRGRRRKMGFKERTNKAIKVSKPNTDPFPHHAFAQHHII